jgi:hypothetical protein
MVGLKSMWRRQLLDCLYVFSGLLGQGEIIWLNDGCPILDYLLSACRQPVVIQMTDQQFQSLIWVLLDSRTYFLPDDCKAASLKVAPGQSPGRNEQAWYSLYLSGKVRSTMSALPEIAWEARQSRFGEAADHAGQQIGDLDRAHQGAAGAVPGKGSQPTRLHVGRSSIPSGCVCGQALAKQGVDICRSHRS